MAVPATTGSLRTKVSEMEIGDYIAFYYGNITGPATAGSPAKFDKLGLNGNVIELPVTGKANPDGYFYFIKVDKGILLADRIVQNGISWDALNLGKYIQGVPWDSGNAIPTMTSNTAPSGVASVSGVYSGSYVYDPWKAFDKVTNNTANRWVVQNTSGWISYQFTSPKVISSYTLLASSAGGNVTDWQTITPKSWTFEGSNNGIDWTVLDTQKGVTPWTDNVKKIFLFTNNQAYQTYRLNISANNGGNFVGINEIEMMETVGLIRSLTGGVAYADANGNSSATDQGKGAWPTNSEWDKYIVNFPVSKIQVGKTLDDVFHWSNVSTLIQDTPIIAYSAATNRVVRGRNKAQDFEVVASSVSSPNAGFRPVFEYKEV
ncbi:discoidin domain-containing protein [Paenibacillus tuaregi]|uniref:discoidin domain-containing protein n=1 Tax=Paenibacillus tuaregi TaxID=1816681 RepID=UPI0008390C89|nr:discoidin domain-containing protein [Paenibacillus tuaregi]